MGSRHDGGEAGSGRTSCFFRAAFHMVPGCACRQPPRPLYHTLLAFIEYDVDSLHGFSPSPLALGDGSRQHDRCPLSQVGTVASGSRETATDPTVRAEPG